MSIHKPNRDDNDEDEIEPYPVPNPEWTPKQEENWRKHGKPIYDRLETELGKTWYRRTWRPKKRNDGMMDRDHVKLGTPEDYVKEHVEDTFDPWNNLTSVMMRQMVSRRDDVDNDDLQEAISDIVRAKLRRMAENDPDKARELVQETDKVASLYGVN